jgi:3'-phosphoadenosine 5'-phosphosulfate (PAPS) 3'-phosphatase
VRESVTALSAEIHQDLYKENTILIDPIDGTREFSTSLGEQCSFCIGFSDAAGLPVAGIVYRPITSPPTYAAGAKSENYVDSRLDMAAVPNARGLLTSNGGISPFIANLITELNFVRVPSGGAGNKMLMLLENKGAAYIQDRGVSRWDTSAAQAVIEAHGGILSKLTKFIANKSIESYTYLASEDNLDFEENTSYLTAYNVKDKKLVKKGDAPRIGTLSEFKAYSNICGLLALNRDGLTSLDHIYEAIQKVKATTEPSYD